MLVHIIHDFLAACFGLAIGGFVICQLFERRLTVRTADLLLVCVAAGIAFSHGDIVVWVMALCGIVTRCLLGIEDGDSVLGGKKDGSEA